MTDSWDKRSLSYGPGFNSAPAPPAPPFSITAFTSPAVDTLRIEGTGFDDVARVQTNWSNGTLFASGVLDPNEAATNLGNGITIITWSDTVIEFTSPYIPTGTANCCALEDAAYVVLLERCNSNLEVGGFPPFTAQ